MNPEPNRVFSFNRISNRAILPTIVLIAAFACILPVLRGAESTSGPAWRPLPLITDGKVDPNWIQVGWGGFVVDDGALRTECDPKGLGLLVYKKERLGNCQVRVVFKTKDSKSNSGIYVRMADGILEQVGKPGAAFDRDAAGKISKESMEKMQASAGREEGPWFAVHRGYEVQIAGGGDQFHGTGSIYSLAPTSAVSKKAGEWQTLIITLAGNRIFVDLDGQRITSFDPASPDLPPQKQWHEPKREPKRPEAGYFGMQNHDPGDVVWFKEVSVRPLPSVGVK
jgi:3-keto-disaccharide hydrolase